MFTYNYFIYLYEGITLCLPKFYIYYKEKLNIVGILLKKCFYAPRSMFNTIFILNYIIFKNFMDLNNINKNNFIF